MCVKYTMPDISILHYGGVPLMMYTMIGLSIGAMVLSTQFDSNSDEIPVPEPVASVLPEVNNSNTGAPSSIFGGAKHHGKSRKHHGKKHHGKKQHTRKHK